MMEQQRTVLNTGIFSAIGAIICTVLFAIFLFPGIYILDMLAYLVSLILSFSIVIMTVALKFSLSKDKSFLSSLAVIFSIIYCVLVSIVYYVQISVVRLADLSNEQLLIVSYAPPGTVFFALDILGYFFLCVSTVFIALSMEKKEKVLRILLFINGSLAPAVFIFPLLPFIYEKTSKVSTINGGTIALFLWCILFVPICVLIVRYFIRKKRKLSY